MPVSILRPVPHHSMLANFHVRRKYTGLYFVLLWSKVFG